MASQKIQKEQKGRAKQPLTSARRPPQLSKGDLERLVEEATVDANGESEQVCGFYTMLENDLELPFNTAVLGNEVAVERIDLSDDDHIVVVSRRPPRAAEPPHFGSAAAGAAAQRMGMDRGLPALGKVGTVDFRSAS